MGTRSSYHCSTALAFFQPPGTGLGLLRPGPHPHLHHHREPDDEKVLEKLDPVQNRAQSFLQTQNEFCFEQEVLQRDGELGRAGRLRHRVATRSCAKRQTK